MGNELHRPRHQLSLEFKAQQDALRKTFHTAEFRTETL
jgi:hypothetical protein